MRVVREFRCFGLEILVFFFRVYFFIFDLEIRVEQIRQGDFYNIEAFFCSFRFLRNFYIFLLYVELIDENTWFFFLVRLKRKLFKVLKRTFTIIIVRFFVFRVVLRSRCLFFEVYRKGSEQCCIAFFYVGFFLFFFGYDWFVFEVKIK